MLEERFKILLRFVLSVSIRTEWTKRFYCSAPGSANHGGSFRLGKNDLNNLRGSNFFKRFSANYFKFSAKFGSLNVQTENNFKNIILIACQWSKIWQYYVNSMVISWKRKWGLNIWFTLFCRDFIFVVIYAFFPAKSVFPKIWVHKNMFVLVHLTCKVRGSYSSTQLNY